MTTNIILSLLPFMACTVAVLVIAGMVVVTLYLGFTDRLPERNIIECKDTRSK